VGISPRRGLSFSIDSKNARKIRSVYSTVDVIPV
jgi:hypothetical protein